MIVSGEKEKLIFPKPLQYVTLPSDGHGLRGDLVISATSWKRGQYEYEYEYEHESGLHPFVVRTGRSVRAVQTQPAFTRTGACYFYYFIK